MAAFSSSQGSLFSAWFFGHVVNDLVLRVIGLASMIYVPWDIISDTILRSHLMSDARIISTQFGGSTLLWSGLWLFLSLITIGIVLRYGLGKASDFHR